MADAAASTGLWAFCGDASAEEAALLKVRPGTTKALQAALRGMYDIAHVTGTQTIVMLTTAFERPISLEADDPS